MKYLNKIRVALTALCLLILSIESYAGEKTTTYFHTDSLGSVVAASDKDSDVIWRKTYDPYGNEITIRPDGQDPEQQSYTGKPFDVETGLVYLGQRYYDPEIRRFMGIDPVGFRADTPVSFNRYAYANNNPYKFVDPDGRLAFIPFLLIAGGTAISTYFVGQSAIDAYDQNSSVLDEGLSSEGLKAAGKSLAVDGTITAVTGGVGAFGLKMFRRARASNRGLSKHGGVLSSTTNASGGNVVTSVGKINQNDIAPFVNSGLFKGDVNIISGAHGSLRQMIPDVGMFKADVARFGNIPGVKVHDITKMKSSEITELLNSPGTTIGGFCDSGACLKPFK